MPVVRESSLCEFFLGRRSADDLNSEVLASLRRVDAVTHEVEIEDMADDFALEPGMLVRLCDAAASGQLSADALRQSNASRSETG